MSKKTLVTLAKGDGIGPEITDAVLAILAAAKVPIEFEEIEAGLSLYQRGIKTGITDDGWKSLRKNKVFLKGPITTPQGGGMTSLNVAIRTTLGLFANVRPCISYHPLITSKHPKMDLVVIRENEEDLYTGIEHQQTAQVFQCLKLVSIPGSEKIIRYAFDYARNHGRKKVSCFIKDNIMKMTDGMFHRVFNEIGLEYPEIEKDHYIIDIGTARLADTPDRFDVIVTPNLYGDIISDVAAQITGSVGIAGSANIGSSCAMFEAIHGAAPDIAGKGIANPSGLLLSAIQLLVHLNMPKFATTIHNALLATIEEGTHTADIFRENSKVKVSTSEFTEAVIKNLGNNPHHLKIADYPTEQAGYTVKEYKGEPTDKKLVGIDIFFDWNDGSPESLAEKLEVLNDEDMKLEMITNRGAKVWPNGFPETFCTDHWRCRFIRTDKQDITHSKIIDLLGRIDDLKLDFIKTENLYNFNGKPGFSSNKT